MKAAAAVVIIVLLAPVFAIAEEAGVTRLHDQTFNTNQTWSGTVIIDGVVQFSPEATLTILPGTTVEFTKTDTDGDGIGENEIYIQGQIIADGTKEKPIVFTSAEEHKRPGDWGAVNIMVSQGKKNELSHCVIEYGYRGFHMHFSKASISDSVMRHNYLGIQCQDSQLEVARCEITGNRGAIVFKDSKLKISGCRIADNYWGVRFLYGEVVMKDNLITGNLINGVTFRETKVSASGNRLIGNRKGFSSEQAQVSLKDNVIEDSDESGLYLKHTTGEVTGNVISGSGDSGVSIEDSDVQISGNDITGNRFYAIDNNGSMDVDARGNWWGTADAAAVGRMMYDRKDKTALGKVLVDPVSPTFFEKKVGPKNFNFSSPKKLP